jgi:SagB-type dehydrogenase family enzyme
MENLLASPCGLSPQWTFVEDAEGCWLTHAGGAYALPLNAPQLRQLFRMWVAQPMSLAALAAQLKPGQRKAWQQVVDFLVQGVFLEYYPEIAGECWAAVVPLSSFFRPLEPPAGPVRLSRFALLRQEEGGWILESPTALCKLRLLDPRLTAAILGLGDGKEPPAHARQLLGACGLLETEGAALPPGLAMWEFHDLYFHARSRMGRSHAPFGLSPRFEGQIDPLPAFKPRPASPMIPLAKPNLEELAEREASLSVMMERRRSSRQQGEPILNVRELGEFLFRTARATQLAEKDGYPVTQRVYPNAGACYELEVYVSVRNCTGLNGGFYLYDPLHHGLYLLRDEDDETEALVASANLGDRPDFDPQVMFHFASRFGRNFWKYQSINYALTLKHVGVLFQNMCLVATSMQLAGCPWAAGNSDRFYRLAGTNYYEETSVGEFLLGGM